MPANRVAPSESSRTKPPCKYGSRCYRKNPEHLRQYSHPITLPPTATASTSSISEHATPASPTLMQAEHVSKLEMVGSGSYGSVFKALDKRNGRLLLLFVIPPYLSNIKLQMAGCSC